MKTNILYFIKTHNMLFSVNNLYRTLSLHLENDIMYLPKNKHSDLTTVTLRGTGSFYVLEAPLFRILLVPNSLRPDIPDCVKDISSYTYVLNEEGSITKLKFDVRENIIVDNYGKLISRIDSIYRDYILTNGTHESNDDYVLVSFEKLEIVKVIFNDPATIVFWSDRSKTIVKAIDEPFDEEKGLAMAMSKKFLGNDGSYYNEFKKWLPDKNDEEMSSLAIAAKVFSEGIMNAFYPNDTTSNELKVKGSKQNEK